VFATDCKLLHSEIGDKMTRNIRQNNCYPLKLFCNKTENHNYLIIENPIPKEIAKNMKI